MKIVADRAIPFVKELFDPFGTVFLIPGHEINLSSIKDADALIVRSVTKVDADLINGSSITFVGTATAGIDHIDTGYLEANQIEFVSAPGANSGSVIEYVLAALFEISSRSGEVLATKTVGVVGYGQVGSRLERRLKALGVAALACDPILERVARQTGMPHSFRSLTALLQECDVLTLHVPLTTNGEFPTVQMIDSAAMGMMRPSSWLLNTSRGGIVDEEALLNAVSDGQFSRLVTDVWAGEPIPDLRVVAKSDIATAHIAGYSIDAKLEATTCMAKAFARYTGQSETAAVRLSARQGGIHLVKPETHPKHSFDDYCRDLIRQMYPIMQDDQLMRSGQQSISTDTRRAHEFRELRSSYSPRYTFGRYQITDERLSSDMQSKLSEGIGVRVT